MDRKHRKRRLDARAEYALAWAEIEGFCADKVGFVARAFWKHGNRADNTDEELARYFEKMAGVGVTDHAVARTFLDGRVT